MTTVNLSGIKTSLPYIEAEEIVKECERLKKRFTKLHNRADIMERHGEEVAGQQLKHRIREMQGYLSRIRAYASQIRA